MTPRHYLLVLAASVAGFTVATAAVNRVIDPFAYFGSLRVPGLNARKTEAAAFTALTKAGQVAHARPSTVLFGTSRVDIGLDPLHSGWRADQRPVYNYGLPDSTVLSMREQLAHVLAVSPVKSVVVGIEFQDFLRGARPVTEQLDDVRQRFVDLARGGGSWAQSRRRLVDAVSSTCTLQALLASAATVASQGRPRGGDVSEQGLTSELPYLELVSRDGQHILFLQKNRDLALARVKAAQRLLQLGAEPFAELKALAEFLAFAREKGVQVTLLMPPYHAHFLEIVDAAGLWPLFEAWKRRVLAEVARHNEQAIDKAGQVAPVTLWDFAIYDPRTTEAIPPPGDRRTRLEWFWEPVHFSKALGDVIVRRITQAEPNGFGERLTAGNIEPWLARDRERRSEYRALRGPEVAQLVELVNMAKRQQRMSLAEVAKHKD